MEFFGESEWAFFGLAIAAAFLYSLQSSLLARFSRKFDALSVSVVRNLSFVVTMSPLLFFADFRGIGSVLPTIIGASFCGFLGLSLGVFHAQKSLPIALVSAFNQIVPVLVLVWSFLFFGEKTSLFQMFFIALSLVGVFFLIRQNHHFPHLDGKGKKAIPLLFLGILFGSLTFFLMAISARNANPIAVGFLWEIFIGFFAFLFWILRKIFSPKSPAFPPRKIILKIALFASPTVLASTLLPLAMTLGNPGIVSALASSSGMIFVFFWGIFLYGEHLQKRQILPLFLIFCGIIGIRLF